MNQVIKCIVNIIVLLNLSACVFAPGMDMRTGIKKGDGLIYVSVKGIGQTVPIINIDEELILQLSPSSSVELIPSALKNYDPFEAYKIGINDVLSVVVWGQPELASVGSTDNNPLILRQVRDDGTFFFPYAGNILAEDLTREQIRLELTRRLDKFFKNPQVDVAIEQYNSRNVVVSGQFNKPITIPVTAVPLTLSQAISSAGGPNESADLTDLQINRDGMLYRLNYHQLANKGEIHKLIMRDGDVLHLPINQSNKAYVVGEVGKPQSIALETGSITLTDALATAQGVSAFTGSGKEVYVIRGVDTVVGEKAIYKLDARSPASFLLASQFTILPQDVVFVGAAELSKWNRVVSNLFPFSSLIRNADQIGQ